MTSDRTLFFGGSFNPIHSAHLACSAAAAREAGFAVVVLIPSHQPVHKARAYDFAPAEDRLAMTMLASEAASASLSPGLTYRVDALELERDGPTYTIDTVEALQQRDVKKDVKKGAKKGANEGVERGVERDVDKGVVRGVVRGVVKSVKKIDWLIGADQLLNLHRWHRFDELMKRTQFWVMQRPGYTIDWQSVDERCMALRERVVSVPQMDVSATAIRQRVREGLPIDHLVPDRVRDYILARKLYINTVP